jgi:hypothetical protein
LPSFDLLVHCYFYRSGGGVRVKAKVVGFYSPKS